MASVPHLQKLYGRYKDQGLVLIGIHSDPNAAKMKETVKSMKMTWPIAQDGQGKTIASLKASGYPTYCLIDRKGILRMNDVEGDELDRAIPYLLKEKG